MPRPSRAPARTFERTYLRLKAAREAAAEYMAGPGASGHSELENLREQITCSICYTVFVEPKILPCHHTFCKQCLCDMILRGQRVGPAAATRITCPTCRQDVVIQRGDVDTLQPSFMINQLKEIVERMEKDDKKFVPTPSASPLQDHVTPGSLCSRHTSQHNDLYCRTCQTLLCHLCIMSDHTHQTHDCGLVEDVASGLRQDLHQCLGSLRIKAAEVSGALEGIALNQTQVETEGTRICSKVVQCRDRLVQGIQQEMDRLQVTVQEITEAKLASLRRQISQLQDVSHDMNALIQSVGELASKGSDVEFLIAKKRLDADIQKQLDRVSTLPLYAVEGPGIAACLIEPGSITDVVREQCSVVSLSTPAACRILETEGQVMEFGKKKSFKLELPAFLFFQGIVEAAFKSRHGTVAVQLQPSSESTLEASVQPTVHTRGKCWLSIKMKGVHISNSPLSLYVASPPPLALGHIVKEARDIPKPVGMALTPDGKLLVASKSELLVFDLSLVREHSLTPPHGNWHPWRPWELAVDKRGVVYVTDAANKALHKFTSEGRYLQSLAARDIGATFFNGVGVYDENTVYICDSRKHQVYILNSDLKLLSTLGHKGTNLGEFDFPDNVAFDTKGNTYITDFNNSRVQVRSCEGQYSVIGQRGKKEFIKPNDICIHRGLAYVTDYSKHCVFVFDTSSSAPSVHQFGSGVLYRPEGLVVDGDGYVYIADGANDRIVVF